MRGMVAPYGEWRKWVLERQEVGQKTLVQLQVTKSKSWKDSRAEKLRLSGNLEWELRRQFKANTELGVSWKEQMLQPYVISHRNVKREKPGLSCGGGYMWCQVWIHIVYLVKEASVREAEKVRCGRTVGTTEYLEGEKRRNSWTTVALFFPAHTAAHALWNLGKLKVTVKEAIECHG